MTLLQNASRYDWSTWLLGILRSFISGGSAAMVSGLSSMGIAPDKFNLTNNTANVVKLMVVMFLFQGSYRMFEFLQLHGAPDQLQQALASAAANTEAVKKDIAAAQSSTEAPK